jgi:hypothetical protein
VNYLNTYAANGPDLGPTHHFGKIRIALLGIVHLMHIQSKVLSSSNHEIAAVRSHEIRPSLEPRSTSGNFGFGKQKTR